MEKINKILIALDYNPTAQKVAEAGYQLAKAMQAQVVLLHVISNPAYYASSVYDPIMGFSGFENLNLMESTLLDELKKTAQEFLDKSKLHLGDETIDTVIKEGNIAEAILETVTDFGIDIIVIGSHSSKWLDKILLGSTAEDVLHQTTTPLFIIPTKNRN
jgi:nucleotide-binding universal stress UspA family protein